MKQIQEILEHVKAYSSLDFINRDELIVKLKLAEEEFNKQLILSDGSKRFSSAEKMAEWLHNSYEEIALNNGWKAQDECQVLFLNLPKENKQTMIEVCKRLLNVY